MISFVFVGTAAGHGTMVDPKPRTNIPTSGKVHFGNPDEIGCEGYACLWFNQGCNPGCSTCSGTNGVFDKQGCDNPAPNFEPWIKANQTEFLTYPHDIEVRDPLTKYSPWRSPGEAPVMDSCGVAAGTPHQNEHAAGLAPPGHQNGDRGSELPPTSLTHWEAGGVAEVSWTFSANHGGGYQYRLCPVGSTLDEECFQKMPLEFVDKKQTLWWNQGPKAGQEVEIDATRLAARDGKVWTKNPIPAMNCPGGGAPPKYGAPKCSNDQPQFTPPIADPLNWGYSSYDLGEDGPEGHPQIKWMPYIKDRVRVPDVEGHYVLSWRWDCEQTPQVWNSCSDIIISKPQTSVHL